MLCPMRALLLLAAFALTACSSSTPTPTTEPPTAPASPTPAPEATPEATPAPVATVGKPWVLSRDRGPHGYVDTFTFYGWSEDGLRYAFEVFEETQGADCGAKHHLFVVDASKDAYAPGGTAVIKHDSPEGGPDGCSPKSLEPLAEAARRTLLGKHGIRAGHLTEPRTVAALGGSGLLGAGDLRFAFGVEHDAGDDIYGEAARTGAAYSLVLDPEGTSRTIEPGTRRRPYVLRYALAGNPVFVSPDGRHAAVVISRIHTAFEGSRLSWMTNGFAL